MLLEDLKKANPVELAENASARNIGKEVAFNWWVPCVLKKKEVITSQVKSKIRNTTQKCRI